jgi:NADPH:quinone reductase-like Zn-dependent oxidoreductase
MRAIQIQAVGKISEVEVPEPVAQEGEALVELKAAALNHRDVWIKLGQYAGLKFPCIPGSDGAGIVRAVGSGADSSWIGREVIINPSFNWGPSERAQGASFSILGLPRDGTLAGKVAVPAAQLSPKPPHMSWDAAAALPLSGLTAWRALVSRAGMSRGDRVLITGIGGGGALFALQFAVASGNEAWVTSSSDEKIEKAVGLGAKGGFRYDRKDWAADAAKAAGPFDVIVDSAGGPGFANLIDAAAPGGRIAIFGATRGNAPEMVVRKVFWKQLSILGSTMGDPADWRAMNDFVGRHALLPVISEVFPFGRAIEAFDLMERGGQFGKIVVRH